MRLAGALTVSSPLRISAWRTATARAQFRELSSYGPGQYRLLLSSIAASARACQRTFTLRSSPQSPRLLNTDSPPRGGWCLFLTDRIHNCAWQLSGESGQQTTIRLSVFLGSLVAGEEREAILGQIRRQAILTNLNICSIISFSQYSRGPLWRLCLEKARRTGQEMPKTG